MYVQLSAYMGNYRRTRRFSMDKPRKNSSALDNRVEIRVSETEKQQFQEAARLQGITLSQWLRLSGWQTITEHNGKVKLQELDGMFG